MQKNKLGSMGLTVCSNSISKLMLKACIVRLSLLRLWSAAALFWDLHFGV